MAVTRASNSGITTGTLKYESMLAGRLALPSIPTIGTATAGDGQASITFTPGSITGSTYTMLSTPGSITASGAASPIVVTGLTNDTAYTFQVRANNTTGSSDYSAASNSVTPFKPNSYESIATGTGTGSSSVITFSSIPQTYKHLQIRAIGKHTGNTFNETSIQIQFNGDTATNYTRHSLIGANSAASADGTASTASILVQNAFLSSRAGYANMFGIGIINILDYTSTAKAKTVRSIAGYDTNGEVNLPGRIVMNGGVWFATPAAITSITLTTISNSWTTTTQFMLYGIKG